MGDNPEAGAEPAPPPPGTHKAEITVAGHSVVVESTDSLADVVGYALSLFEQTASSARRIPIGYDTTGGQFELAAPYDEHGALEDGEG